MELLVPSMPRVVPDRVFDAWSWCASDVVTWLALPGKALDTRGRIDGQNPSDLVFVIRAECSFLPREHAALHAKGYGFQEEWALAPYAIDDATDLLYERRVRPRDVLTLAAPTLPALVWGLHDWAHFHNHGPFDEPAMTELQCDLLAIAWLRINAERVGVSEDDLARVAGDLASLTRRRFEDEGKPPPLGREELDALFAGPYPRPESLFTRNA